MFRQEMGGTVSHIRMYFIMFSIPALTLLPQPPCFIIATAVNVEAHYITYFSDHKSVCLSRTSISIEIWIYGTLT